MTRSSLPTLPVLVIAFALAGAAVTASAQDMEFTLQPLPAQIAPGQQAFVQVEGTFPDTCAFGPEGELTFALNIIADDRVDAFYRTPDPGACGDALTFARAVFGPLPFEWTGDAAQMEISFTLERGDGLNGFGETAVDVVDEPTEIAPESGFWWNPAMSGHGLSLDRQGRDVFGALFSYDESGKASWHVLQARIEGGIVATELLGFTNGNCLVCGDPWAAPALSEEKVPIHLVFEGPAGAWMRIGPEPGIATGLQRFHLEPAASAATDEIPVTVPDLAGDWVRVDGSGEAATVSPSLVRIDRLPEREADSEVVFGFFEDGSAMPSHTLSCSPDQSFAYRACGFAAELGEPPGPPVYQVPWDDIGTDLIEIKGQSLRYIRVPGPD